MTNKQEIEEYLKSLDINFNEDEIDGYGKYMIYTIKFKDYIICLCLFNNFFDVEVDSRIKTIKDEEGIKYKDWKKTLKDINKLIMREI